MKYVSELTEAELATLESAHKNHPISRVRMRAHVIILSFEGRQIKDITKICRISRYAVSRVINRWEENGFRGLFDKPRSGRTKSLTAEDEEFIHKMVAEDPRSVSKIISALEDQRGKKVSRSTLKRAIKKTHLETYPKVAEIETERGALPPDSGQNKRSGTATAKGRDRHFLFRRGRFRSDSLCSLCMAAEK